MAGSAEPDGADDAALSVDVEIACDEPGIPADAEILDWVRSALPHARPAVRVPVELAVRIVDTEEMRGLNDRFRGQDRPTNVLSFPAEPVPGLPEDAPRSIGDIVLCAPVVTRQAAEQNKRLSDHWGHLIVHGVLHLLGFDHDGDAEAAEMEALEARILALRGIADPYGAS